MGAACHPEKGHKGAAPQSELAGCRAEGPGHGCHGGARRRAERTCLPPPWEARLLSPQGWSRVREPASTRELPAGGGTAGLGARRPGCWELGAPYRASCLALSSCPGQGQGRGEDVVPQFPLCPWGSQSKPPPSSAPAVPVLWQALTPRAPGGLRSRPVSGGGGCQTGEGRGPPPSLGPQPQSRATPAHWPPRPSQGGGWPGLGSLDRAGSGCSLVRTAPSLGD